MNLTCNTITKWGLRQQDAVDTAVDSVEQIESSWCVEEFVVHVGVRFNNKKCGIYSMRYTVACAVFFAALYTGLGYPQGNLRKSIEESALADSEPLDEDESQEPEESQHIYPGFEDFDQPPLGHSRPFYLQQEGAYSHRPHGAYQQQLSFDSPRFSGYKGGDNHHRSSSASETLGLLGSGNFGVLRGGTFFSGSEAGDLAYESNFNSFYHNGHGRPSYYRPYNHDQFANFKDFADINVPSNPSYSHYVVVYANKNGTEAKTGKTKYAPKNIIESLELLEQESSTESEVPEKKLSKSKRKLALLPPEKKYKVKKVLVKKTARDLSEPLLALS